jgi:RimJ/RimL family protein N-acetyltransferase
MQIETDRLIVRAFEPGDLAFLVALHGHPEVVRFFGGVPWPEAQTRGWLEGTLRLHRELGLGQHALVRRSDGRLVGRAGLVPFAIVERDDGRAICHWRVAPEGVEARPVLELGTTLAREAWGAGYATEAARAVRDWGFGVRGVERLIALIDPGNVASLRVAERLGFVERGPARVLRAPDAAIPHGLDVAVRLLALKRERWSELAAGR